MSLKFGTDGVRAEAFTVLTTEYVAALANAAAQVLGGGQWLIGRDTRESGPAFASIRPPWLAKKVLWVADGCASGYQRIVKDRRRLGDEA